jgi:hypothetical protein
MVWEQQAKFFLPSSARVGGVGILVKNGLLNDYFATVLDKSYE